MTQEQVRHIIKNILVHWKVVGLCNISGVAESTMYNILNIDDYPVTDSQSEKLIKAFMRDPEATAYMKDQNIIS